MAHEVIRTDSHGLLFGRRFSYRFMERSFA